MSLEDLEFIEYTRSPTLDGNTRSSAKFLCDAGNMADYEELFFNAIDGNDEALRCVGIPQGAFNKDPATGKMEFTVEFIPGWKLEWLTPDLPFQVRYQTGSECVTIGGDAYTWASGAPIQNALVRPLLIVPVTTIVLFGTRANFDAATFEAWEGTVSSDSILGRSAGKVRFDSASGNPKQLPNGDMVYEVEVTLKARKIEWNKSFNEDTGAWEATNPLLLAPASYAALLGAPSP